MKITITQTRQIRAYEPRRIEITFDTLEENLQGDWEDFAAVVIESMDRLLFPDNYRKINDYEKTVNHDFPNAEHDFDVF